MGRRGRDKDSSLATQGWWLKGEDGQGGRVWSWGTPKPTAISKRLRANPALEKERSSFSLSSSLLRPKWYPVITSRAVLILLHFGSAILENYLTMIYTKVKRKTTCFIYILPPPPTSYTFLIYSLGSLILKSACIHRGLAKGQACGTEQ